MIDFTISRHVVRNDAGSSLIVSAKQPLFKFTCGRSPVKTAQDVYTEFTENLKLLLIFRLD